MLVLLFLIIGGLILYLAASEAAIIINYIGLWKTYRKMGYEGWECLIPFYNSFVLYKCVWGNGWFFLLGLIPVGGTIARLITYYQLGKRFGKSTGFCIGLLLLPAIFIFILGIEKDKTVTRNVQFEDGSFGTVNEIAGAAKYHGPANNGRLAMIISSAIVGFLSIILSIVISVSLAVALSGLVDRIGDYINDHSKTDIIYHVNDDDYDDYDDYDNEDKPGTNERDEDWENINWNNDDWSNVWNDIDWDDPDVTEEQIEDIFRSLFPDMPSEESPESEQVW